MNADRMEAEWEVEQPVCIGSGIIHKESVIHLHCSSRTGEETMMVVGQVGSASAKKY